MDRMPTYFQKHQKTLHEISCDSNKNEYLCVSTWIVFDFDGLKQWYVEKYTPNLPKVPCSNDALWLDEHHIVFIEFKNGRIETKDNRNIIFKVYDSLLLLLDDKFDLSWCCSDFQQNISYTREHMDYILVYNKEKYDEGHPTQQTIKGLERQNVQASKSRTKIYKGVRALGKTNLILFGLDRFKGYLFRQVYTLDQDEFQKYLTEQGVT